MIRICIAADHSLVREGLRRLLEAQPDFSVTLTVEDGYRLREELNHVACDVLLLDIRMPGPGFMETLRRLRREHPEIPILILSNSPEADYAIRAFKGGVLGYLRKDADHLTLIEAVRRVSSGKRYMTPALTEAIVDSLTRSDHNDLSDRAFEVLRMLGSGMSTAAVAAHIHLSPKTVGTYRTRIYTKLRLDGMAELIRYAYEHGLTE